jgi:hypothetical protein
MQEPGLTKKQNKVNSINNNKTISPKVSIHFISEYDASKQRVKWQAYLASVPVLAALLIGIGVGSVTVWESKYGNAETQGQVLGALTSVPSASGPENQWSKPISYDSTELQVITTFVPEVIKENRHEPTLDEIKNEERKEKLRKYLQYRKSPFAKSDETIQAFLDSKNMKVMLAISFVESTMGKKCYYHNCSGIGGYPPNLRKYDNHAGWIRDFDSLLERRYKGIPIEKFMGLYVQPGSPNWINGVKQILAELKARGIE